MMVMFILSSKKFENRKQTTCFMSLSNTVLEQDCAAFINLKIQQDT